MFTSIISSVSDFTRFSLWQIVGDGNFAVVRLCYHRQTRREFAAKIIDKAKCQGKEHMIESEIAILSSVSHPNIIQLEEVFDFPNEKYLIMEYVQVRIEYLNASVRDLKHCSWIRILKFFEQLIL